MDMNNLLESFKSALASDSAITAWALATYGRTHKVYVNLDVRDLPAADDCPYIGFYPDTKIVGQSISRKKHGFIVSCCIYDEAAEINAEGNIVEYEGVSRLEDFRKLAETALAGMDIGNGLLDEIEIEYSTVEFFPFMLVGMAIVIGADFLLGEDILE